MLYVRRQQLSNQCGHKKQQLKIDQVGWNGARNTHTLRSLVRRRRILECVWSTVGRNRDWMTGEERQRKSSARASPVRGLKAWRIEPTQDGS